MMSHQELASAFAAQFATLPQVVAVALSGSQASAAADAQSDIDLTIYTTAEVSSATQAAVITHLGGATRADENLPYWGGVNVWVDATTDIMVDCMYLDTTWIEEQVSRVMEAHQPSLGYSTCFCRTVQHARVLYDPHGWFAALQARSQQLYPDALRHAIIAHNHPVLRTIITSYLYQIENAVRRTDIVSVNHRVAGLLASYFDIVFALNRVLHPGEKRLIAFAHNECPLLPTEMDADIAAVLAASGIASAEVIVHLSRLLDRLDDLLTSANFDLQS